MSEPHVKAWITKSGALVLHKTCIECGAENAAFGEGANLSLAIKLREKKQRAEAIKNLGTWRCHKCWKKRNEQQQ